MVPACHNSEDTVTVSGPVEAVREFVKELKSRNVFAKEVNSAGVAFHSYYMRDSAHTLKAALAEVSKGTISLFFLHSLTNCTKYIVD